MFRQVLVPVKFSVCGRLAARHACDVVRAIGGAVTLLHVLEHSKPRRHESGRHESGHPEQEDYGVREVQSDEARFGEARYQEAQACLRQLGLYARRPPTLLIVPALNSPDLGGVASAILDAATRTGAELIMLGLHSRDGPDFRTDLKTGFKTPSQGKLGQGRPGEGRLGEVVRQVLLGAGVPVQVTPCHPETGVRSGGWSGILAGQDRPAGRD